MNDVFINDINNLLLNKFKKDPNKKIKIDSELSADLLFKLSPFKYLTFDNCDEESKISEIDYDTVSDDNATHSPIFKFINLIKNEVRRFTIPNFLF